MLIVACATEDSEHFSNVHFGDAERYEIYEVDCESRRHVEMLENITVQCIENDEVHGDPVKAKHVMMLMKEKGVQVLMNRRFGPNIQRIKIRFLPVITGKSTIIEGLRQIADNYERLEEEFGRGTDRTFVKLS
jgi:predicted Fe-Mo cluster-binding NifX family protein